jgi:hypothetical protein
MNIVKVIQNQSIFMNDKSSDNIESLYNEINNFLNSNFKGFNYIDNIKYPTNIMKSTNFQYISENNNVTVINKFF